MGRLLGLTCGPNFKPLPHPATHADAHPTRLPHRLQEHGRWQEMEVEEEEGEQALAGAATA
jgi:hypothetical protein